LLNDCLKTIQVLWVFIDVLFKPLDVDIQQPALLDEVNLLLSHA